MEEFTCTECGRLVYRIHNCWPEMVCMECKHFPGWHEDAELKESLDPLFSLDTIPEHIIAEREVQAESAQAEETRAEEAEA